MDCSPPGPSVHGIFQARVLEWVAIAFSGRDPTTLKTHPGHREGRRLSPSPLSYGRKRPSVMDREASEQGRLTEGPRGESRGKAG